MEIGRFSVNTYDKTCLADARRRGLGVEVEDFLWPCGEAELARRREIAARATAGFAARSFHGSAVSRDFLAICAADAGQLRRLYDRSFELARSLGIDAVVFHANYFGHMSAPAWVAAQAAFWRGYLCDKPARARIYAENFVGETPRMLADLCDAVGDARFGLCLDVGHAGCNSNVPLRDWISILGARIGHVHLHDNDGAADRHWPPGRGSLDLRRAIQDIGRLPGAPAIVLECDYAEGMRWVDEYLGQ
ncbi:MAG: TIM barrel protein [Clostridiales bacterium]|nr:TIM barrel protein [Clostridiales bacterium]